MMFNRRSMLTTISGFALVASVLVAAPAAAETSAKTEQIAGAAALVWDEQAQTQRRVSATEAEKIVNDYWTAERIASAKPAVPPARTTDRQIPATSKETVTATNPVAPPDGAATRDAWFSNTNGKIYFFNPLDNQTHWCSGGAVNTGSKRLVVTAGHCIHTGGSGGTWMLNWIFIPGYDRGGEPRGRFPAYWFHSSTGWTVDANWQRDFGFVVTHNNGSGQRVVDAAGGHGFRVNGSFSRFIHIAGYPGNRDGGEVQWYCWGTTDQWPGASAYRLGCDFGGGVSGGPWLEDYQSNGLGYVISATQGHLSPNNSGPYYDNHVLDVFNIAKDQTP